LKWRVVAALRVAAKLWPILDGDGLVRGLAGALNRLLGSGNHDHGQQRSGAPTEQKMRLCLHYDLPPSVVWADLGNAPNVDEKNEKQVAFT
jgi:hypothetical protein